MYELNKIEMKLAKARRKALVAERDAKFMTGAFIAIGAVAFVFLASIVFNLNPAF